ncbi:sirohydrochlorin cobaltochelatase [Roseimicrobium gellanilyticum]|uniref:Sirohydrochlorin cobaltochelatase n=1 Tax=Roseimicrobium gellanilyticum TaxID=748857 RepID=A0A366HD93_9BACT|nr:CbiX/SirB N-terminal domain-containing protein [Roseimicrobium gellanilyticum]RBP40423.1 sirohydrochlorin cobaltochelatase [Roseimicrobium gellanilyticum]
MSQTALILVGHGSTLNPDSSTPTHQHADEIRRRGVFDEVVCCFWKEEPSMREVFYMVKSREIFVVPNFISEGYFCQEVIPRELRIDGPITKRGDTNVYYCDPVGVHPSMTKLLLKRANEVAPGVPRDQTALIIVGHGTSLNENSTKAIKDQVTLIREGGYGFAEVLDAYMEEAPFVAKWHEMSTAPNVVVVPFFIADGLHSYQDIPVLLGITTEPTAAASQNEVFWHNPHDLHGRKLYYSSAIGTEALMADVILDQVHDFQTRHSLAPKTSASSTQPTPSTDALEHLLSRKDGFRIGQVQVHHTNDCSWHCHHVDDTENRGGLQAFKAPEDARSIATYDDAGNFRAVKTAPNLRHGWVLELSNTSELLLALDFLYPAAVGLWEHWLAGTLQPVPLRETLNRQTGMYRFAKNITDELAQQMVAEVCDPATNCLRAITWSLTADQPLTSLPPEKLPPAKDAYKQTGVLPLLCVEACTQAVSAARELARANHAAKTDAATAP